MVKEGVPVHAMKEYRGIRGLAPLSLNFGTTWWAVIFHAPAALPPRKTPVTYRIGHWVGPWDDMEHLEKKKKNFSLSESEPWIVQPHTLVIIPLRYLVECLSLQFASTRM
jgi:hypothetical protein